MPYYRTENALVDFLRKYGRENTARWFVESLYDIATHESRERKVVGSERPHPRETDAWAAHDRAKELLAEVINYESWE